MDGVDSTSDDLQWFYADLSKNDPFGAGAGIWMAQNLGLTARAQELVKKYGIDRSDAILSRSFFSEIEALFEEAGIKSTSYPMIPVSGSQSVG